VFNQLNFYDITGYNL